MSTLGKGLESLIPPKSGGAGAGSGTGAANGTAAGQQSSSLARDDGSSILPPAHVVPLPTVPEEEFLPEGHEHEGGPLILSVFEAGQDAPFDPTSLTAKDSQVAKSPSLSASAEDQTPEAPRVLSKSADEHSHIAASIAASGTPHASTPSTVKPANANGNSRETFPAASNSKHYEAIFHIEVDKIKPNPHQPRRVFNDEAIKELAASIREFGILQPIVVTKIEREVPSGTEVEYELIAGERRLMASKLLGLERVPAVIKRVGVERERLEMAIIENLQRENLSAIEMARAYARLQDEFRLTQREIATRLGKSREVVANTLRLLDLPQDIQQAIEQNTISESHGRLLLTIDDPALRQRMFEDLIHSRLTVRELKDKVQHATHHKEKSETEESVSPELHSMQERLSAELGTPVKISQSGDSGKITISFYSKEELESILEKFSLKDDS